jgi:hypothetical protein
MSAHTQGPWRIATDSIGMPQHIKGDSYSTICSFLTSVRRNCGVHEIEANVRLITAAPELLEALIELIDAKDHCDDLDIFNRARAAIAKATAA